MARLGRSFPASGVRLPARTSDAALSISPRLDADYQHFWRRGQTQYHFWMNAGVAVGGFIAEVTVDMWYAPASEPVPQLLEVVAY